MDCDVVLMPPDEVAQAAILTSRRLEQHGTSFTLDGKHYFPHLSLFMLRLKVADLDQIIGLVQQIAEHTPAIHLTAAEYRPAPGWVLANYHKPKELVALQEEVLDKIEPMRDGMTASSRDQMKSADGLALENFRRYGYRYIGDLFTPHITLTRFEDRDKEYDLRLPDPRMFEGTFARLGLYELGPFHTCVRRLAEFDLG